MEGFNKIELYTFTILVDNLIEFNTDFWCYCVLRAGVLNLHVRFTVKIFSFNYSESPFKTSFGFVFKVGKYFEFEIDFNCHSFMC